VFFSLSYRNRAVEIEPDMLHRFLSGPLTFAMDFSPRNWEEINGLS